jgi:hypothetical protein
LLKGQSNNISSWTKKLAGKSSQEKTKDPKSCAQTENSDDDDNAVCDDEDMMDSISGSNEDDSDGELVDVDDLWDAMTGAHIYKSPPLHLLVSEVQVCS